MNGNCPICGSERYKIYPGGKYSYCKDCYRRTGQGLISLRQDGTTHVRGNTVLCCCCGAETKGGTGRKTCGDPLCSKVAGRTFKIWYEPCRHKHCEKLLIRSEPSRKATSRVFCSWTCYRADNKARYSQPDRGRRRTVKRDTALQVAYRNGYRCADCHRLIDLSLPAGHDRSLEIDHILEWSQGGSNDLTNLRPMHRQCHRKRKYRDEVQLTVA